MDESYQHNLPIGVDLLDQLLSFDPRVRLSAAEALGKLSEWQFGNLICLHEIFNLEHPFFQGLHDPADEPTIERLIDEHQGAKHSIKEWKCKSFSVWFWCFYLFYCSTCVATDGRIYTTIMDQWGFGWRFWWSTRNNIKCEQFPNVISDIFPLILGSIVIFCSNAKISLAEKFHCFSYH